MLLPHEVGVPYFLLWQKDCSSSPRCILMWTVAVQLVLFGGGVHTSNITKNCKLFPESQRNVLERLETLTQRKLVIGWYFLMCAVLIFLLTHVTQYEVYQAVIPLNSFTVDVKTEKQDYSYVLQICGDVVDIPGAGIVQIDHKKSETKPKTIGTYNLTQVLGGSKLSNHQTTDNGFFPCSVILPWIMTFVSTIFLLIWSLQVSGWCWLTETSVFTSTAPSKWARPLWWSRATVTLW